MSTRFSEFDFKMMARAIELAKRGRFTTAPNPNVGCVITQGNTIVGEGFHYQAGQPHAEVFALRQAKERAEGGTAYVTLEPCSHYGRTPPCAEALIKANVSKVICAMQDPNPEVAGRGIALLKQAGIDVEVGLLEMDSKLLNPAFIKRMKQGKPFVQLKLAASLDGRTALNNGESKWITSTEARQDVQTFRAQSGAILSSSKTVIDDNASFSVRWGELNSVIQHQYPVENLRQPTRVILDRNSNLTDHLNVFKSDGNIVVVSDKGSADITVSLDANGQLDLPEVLDQLCQNHSINHLWVEAGATLAASFIQQNLVDELIVYLAPKLMGADGRGLVNILGLEEMNQVIDLTIKDMRMVGKDIRLIAQINKE